MKAITHRLFVYLIPLMFLFPLFKESISTFFFVLVAVNTLFYTVATNGQFCDNVVRNLTYTLPFWIIVTGCVLTLSISELKPIRHGLFFLLFPIVFSAIPAEYFSREKLQFYFEVLKNSCAVVAVGYLVAFLVYYDYDDFFVFRYGIPKFRDFVYYEIPFFKIHPTYFTAILTFLVAFSLDQVFKKKKYVELIYIGLFVFMTFMLLSKLNIMFVTTMVFLMLLLRMKLSITKRILFSVVALVTASALLIAVPGITNRFTEMFEKYNKPPVGIEFHSTNIRMAIYTCSTLIAKENFWTGVGYDKIGDRLTDCYQENYDSSFYKDKSYLTHNYFMYILLSGGILSLIAFLYYIGRVLRAAWQINHFLLSIFLLNVLIICFTEDFFYRQFGLFYFSLIFFSFLRMYQGLVDNATSGYDEGHHAS
ncbi:MAG: O-antigen ligase family protein [Flavobacterium sp.]|nr:O-antigen ligase family protein [Flavobacterium sp.]